VQVHGQKPLGAGRGDQIGHQFGRNGGAGGDFTVLPRVAVVRNDGGDAACGSPLHGVDHDQELHQGHIDGRAGGLNDEDIHAPDIFVDFNARFAVAEGCDVGFSQGNSQFIAYFLRQHPVGIAGKYSNSF